jgi:hypothetical protein
MSYREKCPYCGRACSKKGLRFHIRLYHPEKIEVKEVKE